MCPMLPPDDGEKIVKVILPIIGLTITILIFLIARYQVWKSGDGYIDKALAGDNQALAIVAYKMRNGRWSARFFRKNTRRDIIHALCLGWSQENTDPYTKVLIFDALAKIKNQGNGNDIYDEVKRIERKIDLYHKQNTAPVFDDRIKKIQKLLVKLNIT